eukprot:4507466-Prymnesium_polylepis.1
MSSPNRPPTSPPAPPPAHGENSEGGSRAATEATAVSTMPNRKRKIMFLSSEELAAQLKAASARGAADLLALQEKARSSVEELRGE